MENRWQIALSAGLLATLWAGFSVQFNLVTWVGFLACSTYFAQPKVGFKGVISTCCSNLSGVFWAWIVIAGSSFFDQQLISYILTGVVTAAMCLQASYYNFRLFLVRLLVVAQPLPCRGILPILCLPC
jgi:hypothetical protein